MNVMKQYRALWRPKNKGVMMFAFGGENISSFLPHSTNMLGSPLFGLCMYKSVHPYYCAIIHANTLVEKVLTHYEVC